ncbi:MAG: antitoxin [Actinobacteria bacterium]|nr:antitoxin [Actinomycetota bacterium]
MQAKLTLRMDKELIEQAKLFSQQNGKSLSRIVSDYFASLVKKEQQDDDDEELTPLVRSLIGIAKGSKVDIEDYHKYLEEKYK